MGATGKGPEPPPPIPSEPWGGSGRFLRRPTRWDLALNTTMSPYVTHVIFMNILDLRTCLSAAVLPRAMTCYVKTQGQM